MAASSGSASHDNLTEDETKLLDWDPMSEVYQIKAFNNYFQPSFDSNFKEGYAVQEGSPVTHSSVSPSKGNSKEVNLYVGNIPLTLSKEGLRSFFSRVAPINSVSILPSKDPERGTTFGQALQYFCLPSVYLHYSVRIKETPLTYGFVTVNSAKDAESIIQAFHNYSFGTKSNLRVRLGMSEEERQRQRERQKEDEEFYASLYRDRQANIDSQSDSNLSTSIAEASNSQQSSSSKDKEIKPSFASPDRTNQVVKMDSRTDQKSKQRKLCVACYKEGNFACKRCKACYCSAECQTGHWHIHRKDCLGMSPTPRSPTPTSNGTTPGLNGNNNGDNFEDRLLIQIDDEVAEDWGVYNIDEIAPREDLPKNTRILIYVVENLTMKGQDVNTGDAEAFLEMMTRLGEYAQGSPKKLTRHDCREGALVVFYYEGEACRGAITHFDQNSLETDVLAIDYGNSVTLKASDLLMMPKFGLDIPRQCRTLILHGLPSDLESETKGKLNNCLKDLVLESVFACEVKLVKNGIYSVVLEENGKSVNEAILALYRKMKDDSADKKANMEANGYHKIMIQDIPIQSLPKETQFDILVTEVTSPSCFHGQIITPGKENIRSLAEMNVKLQKLPESISAPGFDPVVDEVCLAFFADDAAWSRAVVNSFNSNGTVRVTFFDYGNDADLEQRFIRQIPKEFATLPRQGRRFCHFGIKSPLPGGIWREEANASFKDALFTESICTVDCIEVDDTGICHVEVYLPEGKSFPYKTLLDNQMAIASDPKEPLKPNGTLPLKELFALPVREITEVGQHHVIPVHIESPHEIYVQIADIEKIQKVNEFSGMLLDSPVIPYKNPVVGDSCCALFTDETWYRAKVMSTDGPKCTVYFYDYGNTYTTDETKLRQMPDSLKSLPGQAVKVKLDDIEPVGPNWTTEAKLLLEDNLSFQSCIFEVSKIDNFVAAGNLISEENNEDAAKRLIDANLARKVVQKGGSTSAKATPSSVKQAAFSLETERFHGNGKNRVIPVHVESPDEMYVQIADIEKIQKVNEFSEMLLVSPVIPLENAIAGDSCCALFTDEAWYRAKVMSTDGQRCTVYFYDYGNTYITEIGKLRQMPDSLKSLPGQAVRVKLDSIEPLSPNWTEKEKSLLEESFSFQPCMFDVSKIENGIAVGCLISEESNVDAAKLMIDTNLARSTTQKINSFPAKEMSSSRDQAIAIRKPFTLDTEKLPGTGKSRVIPVHFESPDEIYVQIADIEKIQKVNKFSETLLESPVIAYTNPVLGDSCCALFTDETWYRAEIISIDFPNCTVYFYDYGNAYTTEIRKLRQMPDSLKTLPGQAVRVKLNDIEPVSAAWTDKVKLLLEESLSFQPCTFEVIKLDNGVPVGNLISEENNADAVNILIDANLVRRVSQNVSPTVVEKMQNGQVPASMIPFTLEIERLRGSGKSRVIPVHFESPDEIYVQIADIEKIQMVNEFSGILLASPVVPYTNLVQGDSCCALFTDETWYRAKVVSTDGSECTVYFYDYGNTYTTDKGNLRQMPDSMKKLPGQAVRVKLNDIEPISLGWTVKAKSLLEESLSFQPCTFEASKVENGVFVGNLTSEEGDNDAAKLLIDANLARHTTQRVSSTSATKIPMKDQDTAKISPFSLETEKLVAGEKKRVIPVHVESPDDMYVQIADIEKIQIVNEFSAMLLESPVIPYASPIIGDTCCALFTDETWYRAKVTSADGPKCTVYFYDYGNTYTTVLDNLRKIPEELKSLPGQAVRMRLSGIEPTGGSWTETSKALLEEKISFEPCVLSVSKVENGFVEGELVCEENGADVAKMLIDSNIAKSLISNDLSTALSPVNGNNPLDKISKDGPIDESEKTNSPQIEVALSVEQSNGERLDSPEIKLTGAASASKIVDSPRGSKSSRTSGRKFSERSGNSESDDKENGFSTKSSKWQGNDNDGRPSERGHVRGAFRGRDQGFGGEMSNGVMAKSDKMENGAQFSPRGNYRGGFRGRGRGFGGGTGNDMMAKSEEMENGISAGSRRWQSNGNDGQFHQRGNSRGGFRGRGRGFGGWKGKNEKTDTLQPLMDQHFNQFGNPQNPNFVPPMYPFCPPFMFPPNPFMFPLPHSGFQNALGDETSENGTGMRNRTATSFNRGRGRGLSMSSQRGRGFGRGRGFHSGANSRDQSADRQNGFAENGTTAMTRGRGSYHFRGNPRTFPQTHNGFNGQVLDGQQMVMNNTNANRGFSRGRGSRGSAVNGVKRPEFKPRNRLPQERIASSLYSGATISCVVTNVEDPSHFFIVPESNDGTYNISIESYRDGVKLDSIETGMVCGATSSDGGFFRAVIEGIFSEDKVLVRDGDTGCTKVVDKSGLRRLLPEDFKRPFAAVRCRLFNVMPFGKFKWSNEAIKYFSFKLDPLPRKVTCIVRGEASGNILVSIKDPNDSATYIAEDMVKQGFGHFMRQPERGHVTA